MQVPGFSADYQKLLLRHVLALAETDADLRKRIADTPTETLSELGIHLPEGHRIVVLRPGDHCISLPKASGEAASLAEGRGRTDSRADSAELFFQLEVYHFSSSILPIGHKGDDELHIKLPPHVEVVDVTLVNTDALARSEATLTGTEVNDGVFKAYVHWWFDGWMTCKYSLKVWVNDPKSWASYRTYTYELNTMLASPHVDHVPDPNYWSHIFQSVWDHPHL
ncbi:hypothetical protein BE08_35795 [Sorangium cellulosum]|uniref:Nitrile hydratase alpha /Thiocyanate hydrolase gamma domain-containing protein n=1 Tax=Sorangium cellulosum TaxID=56 RepID=A0A150PQ88_SORCE|nr:hypothetical protein BE08_35795 [Sorangium cellulosum]